MSDQRKLIGEIRKQLAEKQVKTRFAPSPTGYLHMGHVASAIFVWGIADALGAEVILRIENHDRTRCRPEYEKTILEDLQWLGLISPDLTLVELDQLYCRQSACLEIYKRELIKLPANRRFFCRCSRQEKYSGACEDLNLKESKGAHSLRWRLRDHDYAFDDVWMGRQTQNPYQQQRAMPLVDKNGNWTYQFAVVADDIRQGVNLIIRGQDLVSSVGRQLDLYDGWQRKDTPVYLHHPLISDSSGQKLSKRFLSEGVCVARQNKVPAEKILGEAAHAVGLQNSPTPIAASDLKNLFL